jgi:hypothetical protein
MHGMPNMPYVSCPILLVQARLHPGGAQHAYWGAVVVRNLLAACAHARPRHPTIRDDVRHQLQVRGNLGSSAELLQKADSSNSLCFVNC